MQDEFSLRGTEDCERSGRTTVVEQATAVGGDMLAVTGSGPEEVAQLVIASTEALG